MSVSFRTKLLASHVAVAVAVSAVTLLVVERAMSQRMEAQVDRRLESQGQAVARWLQRARHPNQLAGRLSGVVGARVTIINSEGITVGESRDRMEAKRRTAAASAAEVSTARTGAVGRATRYSASAGEQVRYVAVPAPKGLVVRLGLPIGEIDETKSDVRRQIGVGAIASMVVALALAVFVAGPLTRRLRATGELAKRIGAGDYNVSLESTSNDEVGVLSRTLVTAAHELEQTENRRREFLANVAHEIRTPVTSIRGYAETLEGSDVDAETRSEFLSTIHRNSVRIGKLVEDLLELEALQAGKAQALDSKPIAVAPIIRHATDTLQALATRLSATIDVDVDPELTARGDADAIERIVLNLMDNALRHGGDEVTLTVTGASRNGRTSVRVHDDGPGIPDDQRSRIFERFHRGAARDTGGSGLGLPIAHELAQAMNGTLELVDHDGSGTVFELELPA